jgi:hypothetical protein
MELACVNFISALLCDRAAFENAKRLWPLNSAIVMLMAGDVSVDDLGEFLRPFTLSDKAIGGLLTSMIRIEDGYASLIDRSRWHIAQFWKYSEMMDFLKRIAESHSDTLFPFPAWTETELLHSSTCLKSRYLFAFIYDLLYHQLTRQSHSYHYALNLFILCANCSSGEPHGDDYSVIVADSVESLALHISDNFQEFLRTPVYYKLGVPSTLVQLIEKFGTVGAKVLIHANIGWSRPVFTRPNVAKLKQTVLGQFEMKKQIFEESVKAAPSVDVCAVCSCFDSDCDLLAYPCQCFRTSVPSYIEKLEKDSAEIKASPQLVCCSHKLHFKCMVRLKKGDKFRCPICDSPRNAFLPAFSPDLHEFDSCETLEAASSIKSVLFSGPYDIDPPEVLALHIIVLEARAALRPEILDDDDVKALHRNLFLTTVLLASKDLVPANSPGSSLARVIGKCVADLSHDRTKTITMESLAQKRRRSTLTFYRRLALFGYFMLGILPADNPDWDDLLSSDTLSRVFHLPCAPTGDIVHLKTTPLPNDWVDLITAPFNLDITSMNKQTAICLLTGQKVELHRTSDGVFIGDYAQRVLKHGPMLAMYLTGWYASGVQTLNREFDFYTGFANVWVDRTGTIDIGLGRGSLLSLDRTALALALDEYMSGRFYDREGVATR